MVESIKFPSRGTGYIYQTPDRPGPKPKRTDYCFNRGFRVEKGANGTSVFMTEFDEKKYNKEYKEWEESKKFYDEHKGEYLNNAAPYLIGKSFMFEPGKVNIIFGPNGSGKTTILRAIAGNAGIKRDGFTSLAEPFSFIGWGDTCDRERVKSYIEGLKKNSSKVKWSGNVIYYDNFAETERVGYNRIGDMCGTVLGDFKDEIAYRFGNQKSSSGEKAKWLINKIFRFQEGKLTLEKLFKPTLERNVNDTWAKTFKEQDLYYRTFPDYAKETPLTILFDEPEVNFDIATVWYLYDKALPAMCKKFGTQIITVSHSPLILSDEILNNEYVNIISLDENYTKSLKKFLGTLTF